MDKKYYLGYLRDPLKIVENGFQEIEEIEVILIKENDSFKEFTTESNVFILNKNETVDGHKLFNLNSTLIGRYGQELTFDDVRVYFKKLGVEGIVTYTNNIVTYTTNYLKQLIKNTRKKAILGEKEYQEEVKKFEKTYNK